MSKTLRHLTVFMAAIAFGGSASLTFAQTLEQFNLPAQPLADSLRAVGTQSQINVLVDPALVANYQAPALNAKVSVDEALKQLLEKTPFRHKFVDERTVVLSVVKVEKTPGEEGRAKTGRTSDQGVAVRVAQAGATTESGAAEGEQQAAPKEEGEKEEGMQLDEIVVTGTHIRGRKNNTAPVVVLDRKYIDSTGFGTATRLIESLPQNFALASQSGVIVPGVSDGAATQGSSINLRGIGEGTTLTLLNGRRMALGFSGRAADISALPLSAIERVEVLTDGASAIYGSDAVGGVVNFVLRHDFAGAETRLRSGWANGGVNESRVSQALGHTWASGNALVSLEYYKRDLLRSSERDFVPATSDIGSLFPQDKSYSALLSGRQSLTENVNVFADALYTKRDSFNEGGLKTFNKNATSRNPQVSATAGLNWYVGGGWRMEASASYAENKLDSLQTSTESTDPNMPSPYVPGPFEVDNHFAIEAMELKADGSLFALPGGSAQMALGADWRSEGFQTHDSFGREGDFDQIVRSAFAEVSIPIVGEPNAMAAIGRLQLSLAVRFDDYSSFGSSFDPRVGLLWEPLPGLLLRGSYGTSYVAPRLIDYSLVDNGAIAITGTDPGVPGGVSRKLIVFGTDVAGLTAQESTSSSFGLEWAPIAIPSLQLGLNYYRIDYRHRIADPPQDSFVILANPSSFGGLIVRDPSGAQVNENIAASQLGQGFFDCDYDPVSCNPDPNFDPASIQVIVDERRRNLSVVSTRGLDVSVQYGLRAAGGEIQLGLAGTYIFELAQQVSATSQAFDTVDTFYNPPDWRVRGSLGFQRRGWAANLFVNHTDSYTDNRSVASVPISSYTTVDAHLAYNFKERFSSGFLSGIILSVSAQNLLNRNPPGTAVIADFNFRDMGFDPTNANPMGRLLAVEATKSW